MERNHHGQNSGQKHKFPHSCIVYICRLNWHYVRKLTQPLKIETLKINRDPKVKKSLWGPGP